MTHRNENHEFFAKLVLDSGRVIDLGRATIATLGIRLHATLAANPDTKIESFTIHGNRDKDALKTMKSNVQAEYAHEGLNPNSPLYGFDKSVIDGMQMIDEDTMSPFEGITMNRLIVANTSPEFEAYRTFATSPDKRVGVESGLITAARDAWREAYPDVAVHIPPWKD